MLCLCCLLSSDGQQLRYPSSMLYLRKVKKANSKLINTWACITLSFFVPNLDIGIKYLLSICLWYIYPSSVHPIKLLCYELALSILLCGTLQKNTDS
jgi:hypothetical protein